MKQQLISFFKIIRWKNVVIYIFLQILLYFALFGQQFSFTNGWLFLSLSILFLGIFGNIQNNLIDYELDRKKPDFVDFNRTTYLIWAIIFLILGLIFGFTAFYQTFYPTMLYAVLSFPLFLSLYNLYVKKLPLLGNLLIAGITVYAIYIPIAYTRGIPYQTHCFYFLLLMAFLLTFMRELIKDIEDVEYDKVLNYKTLPIISVKLSIAVYGVLNVLFFYFLWLFKPELNHFTYITLLITGGLFTLVSMILLKEKRYKELTQIIKLMMLVGFLSVIFLSN